MKNARWLLLGLMLFDLLLGSAAVFLPDLYLRIMHPRFPGGPTYWLTRTGFLWLFFALIEGLAAWAPERRPALVLVTGFLRLMDVPADLAYLATARDLGTFGVLALIFSPLFNAAAGGWLVSRGRAASSAPRRPA